MDDRIRVSDADRDHVTARMRDHFAQGRLTPDELDERLSAALSAKTVGDLRRIMADLPEPAPVAPRAAYHSQWAGPPPWVARRGGWLLFAFFRVFLLVWLVSCLGGIVFGMFHRRMHRYR
jgi:hypothetical protein